MGSVTPKAQLQHLTRADGSKKIAEVLNRDGGVIVEKFLTVEQIDGINADIASYMEELNPGSTHSDAFISEFHGDSTKRLSNLVQRSKTFREQIFDDDLAHEIADAQFSETGGYWMATTQVIQIGPGEKTQILHRDLENIPLCVMVGPKGPETLLNYFIALTDFTEENGATRVIPGSNHWPDYTIPGNPEDTIPATMKKGDMVVISGKTVHGGGANQTKIPRTGLAFGFQANYLVPEEAYPFIVDMDLVKKMSPRCQRMIGFRSQYPKNSPGLWQLDYKEIGDHLGL